MSQHYVRGVAGPLAVNGPAVDRREVQEWRAAEFAAGRPSSLEAFCISHGICPECQGLGVRMVGWSDPKGPEEVEAARELNVDQLPLYAVHPLRNLG